MNERILTKLSEAKDSVKVIDDNLPDTYEKFLEMSRLEKKHVII